jgi:FAD:protein FMN transferase
MTLGANLFCAILFTLISGLSLTGCFFSEQKITPQHVQELSGEVFGSYYSIKYVSKDLPAAQFKEELGSFFNSFNDEFSTYLPHSVVSKLNLAAANTQIDVSERFIEMLGLAKNLHQETEGAFDPTISPVVKAWGFGGGAEKKVPSTEDLKEASAKVGMNLIQWDSRTKKAWKTKDGVMLDLNAFAPGWAADLIGNILEKKGIHHFMVDISGEILIKGEKAQENPWIIGIEKPSESPGKGVQLALRMENGAIATSGDYRQFFDAEGGRKSHIIDPRTGSPVEHRISSATAITSSAARADAWGTAMMVLGKKGMELAEKHNVKVYLLEAEGLGEFEHIMSPGMVDYLKKNQL